MAATARRPRLDLVPERSIGSGDIELDAIAELRTGTGVRRSPVSSSAQTLTPPGANGSVTVAGMPSATNGDEPHSRLWVIRMPSAGGKATGVCGYWYQFEPVFPPVPIAVTSSRRAVSTDAESSAETAITLNPCCIVGPGSMATPPSSNRRPAPEAEHELRPAAIHRDHALARDACVPAHFAGIGDRDGTVDGRLAGPTRPIGFGGALHHNRDAMTKGLQRVHPGGVGIHQLPG